MDQTADKTTDDAYHARSAEDCVKFARDCLRALGLDGHVLAGKWLGMAARDLEQVSCPASKAKLREAVRAVEHEASAAVHAAERALKRAALMEATP